MVTTRPAGKRSATRWDLSKQQKLQFARRTWSHNNTKCMGADVEKAQFPPVSSYLSSTHLTSGHRTSVVEKWMNLFAGICLQRGCVFLHVSVLLKQGQMPWHIHFPLPLWITYSVILLPVFLLYLCSLVSSTISGPDHIMTEKEPCMQFYCTCALPYRVSLKHICCPFPVIMFEVQSRFKCRSVDRHLVNL